MTPTSFKNIINALVTSHKLLGNGVPSKECFVYGDIKRLTTAQTQGIDGAYLVYLSYPSIGVGYDGSMSHPKTSPSSILYFLGSAKDDDLEAIDRVMDDTAAMALDFIKKLNESGTAATYKLNRQGLELQPIANFTASNYYGYMIDLGLSITNPYCTSEGTWVQ